MNQTSPKWKLIKRAFLGILVLLGILMVSWMLLPFGHGLRSMGYHVNSWAKMEGIAKSLYHFREEHNGVMPVRLSELVPKYLLSENLLFYSPYTTSVMPTETKSQPELIDFFSPYSFAVLQDQRILVSERPGMWLDGTMTYLLLDDRMQPVGTANSCRVTLYEFQRRLLSQFQK